MNKTLKYNLKLAIESNPFILLPTGISFFLKIFINATGRMVLFLIKLLEILYFLPYEVADKIRNRAEKNMLRTSRNFDDVLIIGNGPSLNDIDFNLLRHNMDVFACNGFWKHEEYSKINITHYFLYDKNLFEDIEPIVKFHELLTKKVSEPLFLIPKNTSKKFYKKWPNFLPKRAYYFTTGKIFDQKNDIFSVTRKFESTSLLALWSAIYLGYKNIYLVGFDHDYLSNRDHQKHFYEGPTVIGHYLNVPDKKRIKYLEELAVTTSLFQQYDLVRNKALREGVFITNLNTQSYLDTFGYGQVSSIYTVK